ncbi:hypothetical protein LLH00_01705 [bacterium]|nr:hypothetical protein [bacterium]
MFKIFGALIIAAIIFGYVRMMMFIQKNFKRESRAAKFKVGGQKFGDIRVSEESREERRQRKEVSLREPPRLGRRRRGR